MYLLGDPQGNHVGRTKGFAAMLANGLSVRAAGKVIAASVAIRSAHDCMGVHSRSFPEALGKRQVTPKLALVPTVIGSFDSVSILSINLVTGRG